jgi:hypothetical protein
MITSNGGETPFFSQSFSSWDLICLELFAMSGYESPTPSQKSLNPPPEPLDSIVGKTTLIFSNSPLIIIAKGYTVEEPTILI